MGFGNNAPIYLVESNLVVKQSNMSSMFLRVFSLSYLLLKVSLKRAIDITINKLLA